MAAGAPDSQPLQAGLSAQQLVTPMQPVANTDAVTALVDAFHKGIITAGDINDRIGAEAMAKKKAHIEQLQEYVSPQAVNSRMAQIQAQKNQADLQAQQAQAESGLVSSRAGLIRNQLAQQQAGLQYGADGSTAFDNLAPWYGRSADEFVDPQTGQMDFAKKTKEGNQMKAQMTLADRWINQLTPTGEKEVEDDKGNTYTQKVNWQGLNVTPPDVESGYKGSPAFWAYRNQLEKVLPEYHPLRSTNMFLGSEPDEQETNLGVPKGSSPSSMVAPLPQDNPPAGPMGGSGAVIEPAPATSASAPAPSVTPTQSGVAPESMLGIPKKHSLTSTAKGAMESDPYVQTYSKESPIYLGFADAAKMAAATPHPVNDLALAEAYTKLFDPTARITEFKYDELKKAIPWIEKFKDAPSIIARQHTFPPEVRQQIIQSGMQNIDLKEKALVPKFQYYESQHPGILDSEQKQIVAGVPFSQRHGTPSGAAASGSAPVSRIVTLPGFPNGIQINQ